VEQQVFVEAGAEFFSLATAKGYVNSFKNKILQKTLNFSY
jgi:hypothetical protein